jgi:hypothetical protein
MAQDRTAEPGGPQRPSVVTGRRGWSTVLGLAVVLAGLVAVQLPAAGAQPTDPPAAASAPALPADERVAPRPVSWPVPAPVAVPAPVPAPDVPAVRAAVAPAPVPAPAAADLCSGPGWEQRRGEAALASLRGGAERTGFAVAFTPAKAGYLGMTHLDEQRIDVHVRSCDKESTELLRHVTAHELGHAWDTNRMTDATRAAYQAARGIPASTPWYGCSGCTDFATPAGDFAEVYAQWARGATSNRSELAGDASAAELEALSVEFFGA